MGKKSLKEAEALWSSSTCLNALITASPKDDPNSLMKHKCLIVLLEHELYTLLYLGSYISKPSANTLRSLFTELPTVMSLSITPGSAEPATYLSTSRQINKYYARKTTVNIQTTGSSLQPLKSEMYIYSSAPAETGSNPTYRLLFHMGEVSSHHG